MSSAATLQPNAMPAAAGDVPAGRAATRRSFLGVMRLEWRRQLLTPRVLWPLALAALPVAVTSAMAWAMIHFGGERQQMPNVTEVYANLYHALVVRIVVFF